MRIILFEKSNFLPYHILAAAQNGGIEIPTLCYLKGASPTGACRVCCVEVKGARSLMASCSTPVTAGMGVFTDTEVVHRSRKMIVELMLASGKHNCLMCEANGKLPSAGFGLFL